MAHGLNCPLPTETWAARLSPSGLANRYGVIPFAFPAAVELDGLGALSDALICRRRHDKYAVVAEKRLLLAGAKADVDAYLDRWRKAFELVKEAEMEEFGEKSYFYRKANGLPPADADDDPDPVNDTRAHSFEEPEEERGGRGGECGRLGGRADGAQCRWVIRGVGGESLYLSGR